MGFKPANRLRGLTFPTWYLIIAGPVKAEISPNVSVTAPAATKPMATLALSMAMVRKTKDVTDRAAEDQQRHSSRAGGVGCFYGPAPPAHLHPLLIGSAAVSIPHKSDD